MVKLIAQFKHSTPNELYQRIKTLATKYGTSITGLINVKMKEFADSGGFLELERRVAELEKKI